MVHLTSSRSVGLSVLLASCTTATANNALNARDTNLIPWLTISASDTPLPTALTSTVYYCTCGPSAITAAIGPTPVSNSIVRGISPNSFILF
jgi:hypothetical protein